MRKEQEDVGEAETGGTSGLVSTNSIGTNVVTFNF